MKMKELIGKTVKDVYMVDDILYRIEFTDGTELNLSCEECSGCFAEIYKD